MAVRAKSILVVDDDFATLEVVKLILEGESFLVRCASDGDEALEVLAMTEIDLVLSDYKMPKLDGLRLLARIRSDPRTAAIPFVMMSATYALGAQGTPDGAAAFLTKPLRVPELLEVMRRIFVQPLFK